ncbi:MAG TPA: hypothetical protein VJN88_10020 [Ktedonobacterales bacterium]|nr:hypothetical protein [Ktedonobacterales bacterium]
MQQVRCGLCGRGFLGDLAANPACPSCGYAGAIAVNEAPTPPAAAAVPADVSIVRHFDPATMGQPVPTPVEAATVEAAPVEAAPIEPFTPRADESPTLPSQQPYAALAPTPPSGAHLDPGMTQAETPPFAPVEQFITPVSPVAPAMPPTAPTSPAWQAEPPAAAQPAMTPPAPFAPSPPPMPAPPAYTPTPEAPFTPTGYAPYQAPPTQPPAQPQYPYAPVQAPGAPFGYPPQPLQPQSPLGYPPPLAPTLPYGYPPQGMPPQPSMPLGPGAQPTYGGPYGAPGGPQPAYPGMTFPPQPPQKRRNNTLIAVIAGVVLLAIVLGVIGVLALKGSPHANATPTPTATTQPTPTATATTTTTLPGDFTAYTDANHLYSIGYPSSWSKTETSASSVSETLFANSDHSDIYEVAETPGAGLTTSQLSSVLGGFFTGFAGSLPGGKGNVTNETSPQDVTIAGQTWTQEAADVHYTDTSGASATAHAEVAAIVNSGHIFIIADVTQDATAFETEKSLYFTPMTDTFTFLG